MIFMLGRKLTRWFSVNGESNRWFCVVVGRKSSKWYMSGQCWEMNCGPGGYLASEWCSLPLEIKCSRKIEWATLYRRIMGGALERTMGARKHWRLSQKKCRRARGGAWQWWARIEGLDGWKEFYKSERNAVMQNAQQQAKIRCAKYVT